MVHRAGLSPFWPRPGDVVDQQLPHSVTGGGVTVMSPIVSEASTGWQRTNGQQVRLVRCLGKYGSHQAAARGVGSLGHRGRIAQVVRLALASGALGEQVSLSLI